MGTEIFKQAEKQDLSDPRFYRDKVVVDYHKDKMSRNKMKVELFNQCKTIDLEKNQIEDELQRSSLQVYVEKKRRAKSGV